MVWHICDVITMTSWWARWRLKSPASRLFTSPFIQGADQRKHQSSVSLAFVRGIHRWTVNSPHKRPVTRTIFPFDDVIMFIFNLQWLWVVCPTSWRTPWKTISLPLSTAAPSISTPRTANWSTKHTSMPPEDTSPKGYLTHWPLGDVAVIFKVYSVKLSSGECHRPQDGTLYHRNSLMRSQHLFMW